MPCDPTTRERRFALADVVHIAVLADDDRFAAATPDTFEAVLGGFGRFAAAGVSADASYALSANQF